jgi:hypothetical protein
MDKQALVNSFLMALEEALANDHINHGFLVKSPDWYLDAEVSNKIESYYDSEENRAFNKFFDLVEYYFDAKSHNFPELNGVSLDLVKEMIIKQSKEFSAVK